VIAWLDSGDGWGTREQAIPGEWALLVLLIVLGAVLGLLVLWFTLLRHERTVRRRVLRRNELMLTDIGAAADEPANEPAHEPADGVLEPEDAEVAEVDAAGRSRPSAGPAGRAG
jgi:hypothetical protein